VVTSDNKIIFIETAAWKGEGACRIDRPGGHAEPEECFKSINDYEKDYKNLSSEVVVKELFESIRKEIRDELNIPVQAQSNPELLGIIYNLEHGGRLTMDYFITLSLDSNEVFERYSKGGKEADESTGIFFISMNDILKNEIAKEIVDRLTPHSKGSLELLKIRLKFYGEAEECM